MHEGAELKTQSEIVLKNNVMQQKYADVFKSLALTEEERALLKGHILTESDTVKFLSEVESIARRNEVNLTTNSLTVSDKKEGSFEILVIKFSVDGGEKNIHKVLQVLETLPYYSQVTELQLARRENAQLDTSLSGALTLTLSLR